MKVNNVLEVIGNTPLVKLNKIFGSDVEVWMKLERQNPGGSIKDRIALAMIETAEKEGKDLVIAFNPKYINDVLKVIDDEEVTLYLFNANAPCFIKNEEESYIYLILPVNMN